MLEIRVRRSVLAGAAALAVTATTAASASAETTPPVLQSFSILGPATVDTTNGNGRLAMRARVTDVGSGAEFVQVTGTYTRGVAVHPDSAQSGLWAPGLLERVSGTANDGVYEGEAVLGGGTLGTWAWTVTLRDFDRNRTEVSPQQLAARGWASSTNTTTTKVPAAPKLSANVVYPWITAPYIAATVTLTQPPATPAISGHTLVSSNAACGTPQPWTHPGAQLALPQLQSFINKRFLQKCTVTLRSVNAAGASAPSTLSFR